MSESPGDVAAWWYCVPMTSTETPDTTTDEWWQDGRNVSMLVNWYIDREAGRGSAVVVRGLYEHPWIHDYLWHEFQASLDDAIDKLLEQ